MVSFPPAITKLNAQLTWLNSTLFNAVLLPDKLVKEELAASRAVLLGENSVNPRYPVLSAEKNEMSDVWFVVEL